MKPQEPGPCGPGAEPGPDPEDGALSYRRERFCIAFVRHGNAARAARDAGYAAASAKQRGHRLLALGPVRARIGVLAADADNDGADETRRLGAKLDMLFEQAMDARAFHAAARALELQARLAAGSPGPPGPPAEAEPDLDALVAQAEAALADIDAGGGGGEEDGDDRG